MGTRLGFSAARWQLLRRVVALGLFGYLIWDRVQEYGHYNVYVWGLETLIFVVLLWNFGTRVNPVSAASGFWEEIFPFMCAALPFALVQIPWNAGRDPVRAQWCLWLLVTGNVITVVAMATLGRSFGVSVAARRPVMHGIYRLIRHPVYLGEIIGYLGFALGRLEWRSMALVVIFAVAQTWRGTLEERKLSATFPEYDEYRRRTGRYIPGVFRGR